MAAEGRDEIKIVKIHHPPRDVDSAVELTGPDA